ncbi:MAG: hypothetical protein ACX94B_14795 [Henriciella sp.]|nr:hypothetical protein [Hyphomonadaceae bacterium]
MTGMLIVIRNFTIALLLAWMGFSVSPDSEDDKGADATSPASSAIGFFAG